MPAPRPRGQQCPQQESGECAPCLHPDWTLDTGHWTLDTDIGRGDDDDDDDDGTRFQLFFSYYLSLTVRAATATSQYRYLLFAAQHRTPSIVNTNTEMKTQHNPFVILSIINLHLKSLSSDICSLRVKSLSKSSIPSDSNIQQCNNCYPLLINLFTRCLHVYCACLI